PGRGALAVRWDAQPGIEAGLHRPSSPARRDLCGWHVGRSDQSASHRRRPAVGSERPAVGDPVSGLFDLDNPRRRFLRRMQRTGASPILMNADSPRSAADVPIPAGRDGRAAPELTATQAAVERDPGTTVALDRVDAIALEAVTAAVVPSPTRA